MFNTSATERISGYTAIAEWVSHETRNLEYDYSEKELKRIVEDATKMSKTANRVFISFCNSAKGYAPKKCHGAETYDKDSRT